MGFVLFVFMRLSEYVHRAVPQMIDIPSHSVVYRLGQVENAKDHLCLQGQPPDTTELQKLQLLEKHISRCVDARKVGDWKGVLQECDAIMVAGAVSSPQVRSAQSLLFLLLFLLERLDR